MRLDSETLHGYRNRHMAYRAGHLWKNLSDEQYLERIGAAAYSEKDGQAASDSDRPVDVGSGISYSSRIPGVVFGL